MKRPILYWVILFILGEVLYKMLSIYVVGFVGGILLIYIMKTRRLGKRWILQSIGIIFFFLGVFCMDFWSGMQAACNIAEGTKVTFCGSVLKREETASYTSYIVRTETLNEKEITTDIQVYLKEETSLILGSDIMGIGVVEAFSKANNPGEYDEEEYKSGNGILLLLKDVSLAKLNEPFFAWREYLYGMQSRMSTIYSDLLADKNASLATAMVLGDKKNLDADVKALYQRNGIAHLIAISGLHIAMIGGSLYKLLRRMTGSYLVAAVVGVVFIIAYGVMTGLSGATLRAVIMLITSMGADVCGRKYDGLTAIALAVLIMLIRNPYQITQVGFLLSFGAVIGIILIQPLWKIWFPKLPKCLDGLLVSISVQMVLLPIMLYFFYEIPVYGVGLNVLVVPVMNILLTMLILCGVMGMFSMHIAAIPAKIADVIFNLYEWLCKVSERFPGHTVCTGRPDIWWIVLYYILLVMLVIFLYQKQVRKFGCVAILFCLLCGVLWFPSRMLVCMYDVGQGDSIYIRTKNRSHILVDGGSNSEKHLGKYVLKNGLKYYGASDIDYVFVTHSDSDHYSGIKELLEENMIGIRNFVLPDISNPDDSYRELETLAMEKGCNVYHIKKGERLEMDGVLLQCLNPQKQDYKDKNAGSIVMQLTYGDFDMLLTGDLNAEEEKNLLQDMKRNIEVLKVAHHGSATSSSEVFLRWVHPLVACVSVGENNQYGHPAKEVMERLQKIAGKIYLTKDCGAITIETDGKEFSVSTFLK